MFFHTNPSPVHNAPAHLQLTCLSHCLQATRCTKKGPCSKMICRRLSPSTSVLRLLMHCRPLQARMAPSTGIQRRSTTSPTWNIHTVPEKAETKFERIKRQQKEAGRDIFEPFEDQEEWDLARWLAANVGQKATDEFLMVMPVADPESRCPFFRKQPCILGPDRCASYPGSEMGLPYDPDCWGPRG